MNFRNIYFFSTFALFINKLFEKQKFNSIMNINDLYNKLQKRFLFSGLNGELSLNDNCIVWTYNCHNDADFTDKEFNYEEDGSGFESISSEEELQNAYNEDIQNINEFFDEIEEMDNWSFTDANMLYKSASFKIF